MLCTQRQIPAQIGRDLRLLVLIQPGSYEPVRRLEVPERDLDNVYLFWGVPLPGIVLTPISDESADPKTGDVLVLDLSQEPAVQV